MSKLLRTFELSISPTPPKGWGVWEMCREAIQNGLDEGSDDHPATILYDPGSKQLQIINPGSVISPKALVTGVSDKPDGSRGRHGDGLKGAIQVALSLDRRLTIHTDAVVWVPRATVSKTFDTEVVAVDEFEVVKRRGRIMRAVLGDGDEVSSRVMVIIHGIIAEEWDMVKGRVLTLHDHKSLKLENGERILTDEKHRGLLFSRDLYVGKLPEDFEYGYDLLINLDRDRRNPDPYDIRNRVKGVTQRAVSEGLITPKKMLEVMEGGKGEAASHQWYSPSGSANDMIGDEFVKKHGDRAVPVSTIQEAENVSDVGWKPVRVNPGLKELLSTARAVPTIARARSEATIDSVIDNDQMDDLVLATMEATAFALPAGIKIRFVEFSGSSTRFSVSELDGDTAVNLSRDHSRTSATFICNLANALERSGSINPVEWLSKIVSKLVVGDERPHSEPDESESDEPSTVPQSDDEVPF